MINEENKNQAQAPIRKKPKKRKKKATGAPHDEAEGEADVEDEVIPVAPVPAVEDGQMTQLSPTMPARRNKKKKKGGVKTVVDTTAAPPRHPLSNFKVQQSSFGPSSSGLFTGTQSAAQSAHSYLKSEGLLGKTDKQKTKKSTQASEQENKRSLFIRFASSFTKNSNDAAPGRTTEDVDSPSADIKAAKHSFFVRLTKRTKGYMHQLLRTSEDETRGLKPMKWDHFVKVCTEVY